MTSWNGSGLPPVAAERVQRFHASPMRTSLLSVPAAASVEAVGFDTVGEVMGCMVQQISWTGWGGCGYRYGAVDTYRYGGPNGPQIAVQPASNAGFSGYGPYVTAVETGYDTALRRMLLEAAALGADGVVGVKLTETRMEGHNREFMALGTAVRARSRTRPAHPFTTDLTGTDFAKLLLAGWTPVALHVALDIAIRHDDYRTTSQQMWGAGNAEVSGYTDLVHQVRARVRDKFASKAARSAADGTITSGMSLAVWEIEPADNHTDHVAEATLTGTAIARFSRRDMPATSPLTILPTRLGR